MTLMFVFSSAIADPKEDGDENNNRKKRYRHPGTEVDGGHEFSASHDILHEAINGRGGVIQIVGSSRILIKEGNKDEILDIVKNRIWDGSHEYCYRDPETKQYSLELIEDRQNRGITICRKYFENFQAKTGADFEDSVWTTRKKIFHEISHLFGHQDHTTSG